MADVVNVGTGPNTGDGDDWRTAWIKANAAFVATNAAAARALTAAGGASTPAQLNDALQSWYDSILGDAPLSANTLGKLASGKLDKTGDGSDLSGVTKPADLTTALTTAPRSLKGNLLGASAPAADVSLADLSGAIPLALLRSGIAASVTIITRFRTLDGAPRKVDNVAGADGPDAIQNASGDWIVIDLVVAGNVLEPEWFGAVGDFSPVGGAGTDNAAAMARLFAAVPDGGAIYLRAGLYGASAWPTTYGKGYAIVGHGRNVSALVSLGGANGPNIQTAYDAHVALVGFSMLTTGVDQSIGLTVQYNIHAQHIFGHRLDRKLFVSDFCAAGVDQTTHGWSTGLRVTNVNGARYRDLWFIGRSPGGSEVPLSPISAPYGLVIDGTGYPTDHVIDGFTAYGIDVPIRVAGAVEGVIVTNYTIVGCNWGLVAQPDTNYGGRPQIVWGPGHLNTREGGVQITAYQNVTIRDGLWYRSPQSPGSWVGAQLFNVIDAEVVGNQIANQVTNPDGTPELSTTGISISGSATSNIRISANHLGCSYPQNKLGTGIASAGTPGVTVAPDNLYNCQTNQA